MTHVTWSYSSLSLFDQCPKKYYHLRVAKDVKEPTSTAMLYGSDMHLAAEKYIRDGDPLPGKYLYAKDMLDRLNAIPGKKLCEYEMGVKYEGGKIIPCGFHDPDRYWRGIADLLIIDEENHSARLVDYKTGKSAQYADTKQLRLLAGATFAHFPSIKTIKAGLLFVVHEHFVTSEYARENSEKLWNDFIPDLERLRLSHVNDSWQPNPTPLCGWCPVSSCEFNKQR